MPLRLRRDLVELVGGLVPQIDRAERADHFDPAEVVWVDDVLRAGDLRIALLQMPEVIEAVG